MSRPKGRRVRLSCMIDFRYRARLETMIRTGECKNITEAVEIMLSRGIFNGPDLHEKREFHAQMEEVLKVCKVLAPLDLR